MTLRTCFFAFLLTLGLAYGQEGAQPKLPTATLSIKGVKVTAEVADDDHERTMGLMFRDTLEPNSGMLFVMPSVSKASFWMRNTKLPLSIAYINPSGVIMEIHDLEPFNETPVKSHFPNIAYALEMKQGWFTENKILPGDRITGIPAYP